MRTRGSRIQLGIALLSFTLLSVGVACHDNGPTAPDFAPALGPGPGAGMGPSPGGFTPGPLTAEVAAAMQRAIVDEYHAEAIYSRVLEDLGNVIPFANVVNAEARHSESIARVYTNHEMAVPADPWHRDNVPRFRTVAEACGAAAVEEEKNIAMYDELLRLELPDDVVRVFSTNRLASLESHLPAFRFCAGG